MGEVDAHRAEVAVLDLAGGGGKDDGAVRQEHAVIGGVAALDVRGPRGQPGASAVGGLARPQLVAAVAPGGEVDLRIQELGVEQDDLALAVLDEDGVVATVADVAAHCVGIGPRLRARLQHRDPVLGIAPHGVTIPLQKATVPHGQQVSVGGQRQAGHMVALALVKPFHYPFAVHDRRFHRLSAPLRIVEENQGRFQAAHTQPQRRAALGGPGR